MMTPGMNIPQSQSIDKFNYWAIDYLEQLGNDAPTQQQISLMESLLKAAMGYEIQTASLWGSAA